MVRQLIFILSIILAAPAWAETDYFEGKRGCFLLYDMQKNVFLKEIGGETCKEQFVACSTFKVPLAVIAFDAGLLEDENQVLKWDGVVDPSREVLNKDHNAKSWMRESIVWFSQRLTPQLGEERFKKYLKDFHYGNQDLSAGITTAWLVPPTDPGPALKISPYEQVKFMRKLWTDSLPVAKRAMKITRDLTLLEVSEHGFTLSGKTGSNFYNSNLKKRLGWFIGHIENFDGEEYIAVTYFNDLLETTEGGYGGAKAKEITKKILADQGLW